MIHVSISEHREPGQVSRTVDATGFEPVVYRFEGEVLPPPLASGDFAALAMLPIAMARREPLHVHHRVDRLLLENLEEYESAWTAWRPDLFHRVDITVDEEIHGSIPAGTQTVAAYSGGVDATFLIAANAARLHGRRSRDIAAAVLVHGFDIPCFDGPGFHAAVGHAQAILETWHVPLVTVFTNWMADACPDWEMTFALGLAAVLHQFSGVAGVGQLASDIPYQRFPTYAWGSNPVTDRLLSSGGFRLERFGADYDRIDRCRVIGAYPVVREHVRVCWEGPIPGENCGRCEKCIRTRLDFLAAGYDDVPAFDAPLTADDVSTIELANEPQLAQLRAIAAHPLARDLPEEIRLALADVIDRGLR